MLSQPIQPTCQHVSNPAMLSCMKKPHREGKAMKALTVRVPEKLIDRLKLHAVKEHSTVQDVVAAALERYLKASREAGQ